MFATSPICCFLILGFLYKVKYLTIDFLEFRKKNMQWWSWPDQWLLLSCFQNMKDAESMIFQWWFSLTAWNSSWIPVVYKSQQAKPSPGQGPIPLRVYLCRVGSAPGLSPEVFHTNGTVVLMLPGKPNLRPYNLTKGWALCTSKTYYINLK